LSTPPPNIVILMADQMRHDVMGCAGHPLVQTPHLDALAHRGTRFSHAFCTSPLCGPSRASFFTGTHPNTNGGVSHPNGNHRSGKKFFPQLKEHITSTVRPFRDAGYRTHASGYRGFHVFRGEHDFNDDLDWLGFQTQGMEMHDYELAVGTQTARQYQLHGIHGEMWEPSYANIEGEPFPLGDEHMFDSRVAQDASAFLGEQTADQPFLLYCGFRAPHTPWCAPPQLHDLYDPKDIGPLPDYRARHHHIPRRLHERIEYFDIAYYPEQMVRRSIAGYYGFVSYLDDCVGRVLQALDATGQRENTIVVFASDHGEMLYRHGLCEKQCFFEDSVRIPMIMNGPGVPQGQTTDAFASLMDVLPTMQWTSGLEPAGICEAVDLRPALRGETVRDHVMAEFYHSLDPCRMVRDGRYKYIHTEDDICELYDLNHDPDEMLNLAWYPQYRPLVEHYDALVCADWDIPDMPLYATWRDLNERKQKQRLAGLDIIDTRPPLPDWAQTPAPA